MANDLNDVLDSMYEAAVVRTTWPTALEGLAALFGSRGTLLTRGDREHEGLLCSAGLNPTVSQFFEQGWHLKDYRTPPTFRLGHKGFVTDQGYRRNR